jgi:polar amino acid transport system substrate-binding protein
MKKLKILKIILTGFIISVLTFITSGCDANNLTIATNAYFAPFEYIESGKFVGIDMDIAKILADELGLKLQVKDMEFDSVLIAVQNGTCDIAMAGLTVTERRRESVDFCQGYFNASQMVITRTENNSVGNRMTADEVLTNLKGQKIGVVFGFTGQFFAEGDEDFEFEGIEGADIKTYTTGSLAVAALKNGSVDYVIIDNVPAEILAAGNSGTKLINVPLTEEEYAFAVKKGNSELLSKVNNILSAMKTDGRLSEIIRKYYI